MVQQQPQTPLAASHGKAGQTAHCEKTMVLMDLPALILTIYAFQVLEKMGTVSFIGIQLSHYIRLLSFNQAGSRGTGSGSTSGGIPQPVTDYLKNWLLSPEHINNPFPTEEEKERLQAATGLKKKQIQQWFSNNRKRFFSNAISEIREVNGLGEDDLIPHHIAAAAAAEYSTSLESLAAAAPALAVAASQESKVASSELIHPDAVEAAPQVNNAPFMLAPPAFQEDAPIQLAPPAAEPADDGLENIEIVEI